MHTMISIATRCDLGWATNCFPLRGGRWGNVASQDLKKALSKKLPSSEPGVPKHYQVRTSARRMFKGSTWSRFRLFLGDIPRGAFHPPPRTRTGVAAYLGFLHHRAGNSLCFSFVWIFCFLDPTPFFFFSSSWFMLLFWWRMGDKISETAYRNVNAIQLPDLLYVTRLFPFFPGGFRISSSSVFWNFSVKCFGVRGPINYETHILQCQGICLYYLCGNCFTFNFSLFLDHLLDVISPGLIFWIFKITFLLFPAPSPPLFFLFCFLGDCLNVIYQPSSGIFSISF